MLYALWTSRGALTPDDLAIHRQISASGRGSLLSLTSNSNSLTFLSFSSPYPQAAAKNFNLPVLMFSLIPINYLSSLLSLVLHLWIYSAESFESLNLWGYWQKCSFWNFLMEEGRGWILVPDKGWFCLPGRYLVTHHQSTLLETPESRQCRLSDGQNHTLARNA